MKMPKDAVIMPLWDYIILEKPEDEKSRIVLPEGVDKAKLGTLELEVLYVGPDVLHVKPHDRLVFAPQAVITMAIDNRVYYLIGERAVGVVVGPLRKIEKSKHERLPK